MVWVVAHRGSSAEAPENTLAAIHLAIEQGANMVEIDVRFSRDGEPIVIHDGTLDRTTDGTGKVSGKTLDELKSLDAGRWFSRRYQGERIPTFEEVVAFLSQFPTSLIAEVKEGPRPENFFMVLCEIMRRHDFFRRCYFKSFNQELAVAIQRAEPEARLGYLTKETEGIIDHARALGCEAISIPFRNCSAELVTAAHRNYLKVMVWTVDKPILIKRMLQLEVDAIISNVPLRVVHVASRHRPD